jgi:hypothetical protein
MSGPTSEPKGANGKEAVARNSSSLLSVSLLKVCGAVRGIGEKFAGNPLTGTGSMTVPIYMSRGCSGSRPQLTIFAYTVALIAVGGAVVATMDLAPAVKHTPTLFLCSVILSSWFGGVGPGIFAGLLSAIALDYFFIAAAGHSRTQSSGWHWQIPGIVPHLPCRPRMAPRRKS